MPPLSAFVPKLKRLPTRLPPARMALFRSIITHPLPPFAAPSLLTPPAAGSTPAQKKLGRKQIIYSTSPRPLIPLTMSPENHRLWNPPASDALGSRVVERDESGRLAKFAARFAGSSSTQSGEEGQQEGKEEGGEQFAPEADLSFLEGETLQSPNKALGKRDIIGKTSSAKKGKK